MAAPTQGSESATTQPITTTDSPIPAPIVTTTRLIIRPMHPQDAIALQLHGDSPTVAKHMSYSFPSPYTLQAAHTWISQNLTAPFNHFAICEISHPDVFIGGIGMVPGRDVSSHTAEVGYWINEKFTGKGYMTEALTGLTDWVFTERPEQVRRLWARVFGPHEASMRCLKKAMYEKEGIMKGHAEKFGVVMDEHVFGLTREDWEKRQIRQEGRPRQEED